jgi:outer membrane protein
LTSARSALAATILGRRWHPDQPDVLDAQQRVFAAELDVVQGSAGLPAGPRFCCRDGQVNEDTLRSLNDWLVS